MKAKELREAIEIHNPECTVESIVHKAAQDMLTIIEAREKATSGEWLSSENTNYVRGFHKLNGNGLKPVRNGGVCQAENETNATFITTAANIAGRWIDE